MRVVIAPTQQPYLKLDGDCSTAIKQARGKRVPAPGEWPGVQELPGRGFFQPAISSPATSRLLPVSTLRHRAPGAGSASRTAGTFAMLTPPGLLKSRVTVPPPPPPPCRRPPAPPRPPSNSACPQISASPCCKPREDSARPRCWRDAVANCPGEAFQLPGLRWKSTTNRQSSRPTWNSPFRQPASIARPRWGGKRRMTTRPCTGLTGSCAQSKTTALHVYSRSMSWNC